MKQKRQILILLFILFLVLSQNIFSQKEEKLILKYAPLSLIDLFGPNIHFGTEFISKGRISL